MQLKETGLFDIWTKQWPRKYVSSIYTQFVCKFMSISVANKVYRYFSWLDFGESL